MKQISFWAREHKFLSRILIIFGFFFLNICGLFSGDMLFAMNIVLTPVFYFAAILIFLFGLVFYPLKKNKKKYFNFYRRQKLTDGILIFSTFLFLIYFGNASNRNTISILQPVFGISVIPYNRGITKSSTVLLHSHKADVSKNSFRKLFFKKIQNLRKSYKNSSDAGKIGLIVLTLLAGGALMYGLMGLSCTISCSGSEGVALIVLLVGGAAIIFGVVKLIQRITRGKPVKETPEQVTQ